MARRGASHSFNKRQKERKRKEKADKKQERRLLRKQGATGEAEPSNDEGSTQSPDEFEAVEADTQTENAPRSNGNE